MEKIMKLPIPTVPNQFGLIEMTSAQHKKLTYLATNSVSQEGLDSYLVNMERQKAKKLLKQAHIMVSE